MLLLAVEIKLWYSFFSLFNHVVSFLGFRERQQSIQEQEPDRSEESIEQFNEIVGGVTKVKSIDV